MINGRAILGSFSSSPEPVVEFRLSDLLANVGVALLDKKGSVRCYSCEKEWTIFDENGGFYFAWWLCPNGCNEE
jgi:hypothetical protein